MSNKAEPFTFWHGLLLAEGAAIMISLLMPLTPPKMGSGRSLAHIFYPEPSYFQEVVVNFVFVNFLLIIIGVVIAVWWRFAKV